MRVCINHQQSTSCQAAGIAMRCDQFRGRIRVAAYAPDVSMCRGRARRPRRAASLTSSCELSVLREQHTTVRRCRLSAVDSSSGRVTRSRRRLTDDEAGHATTEKPARGAPSTHDFQLVCRALDSARLITVCNAQIGTQLLGGESQPVIGHSTGQLRQEMRGSRPTILAARTSDTCKPKNRP